MTKRLLCVALRSFCCSAFLPGAAKMRRRRRTIRRRQNRAIPRTRPRRSSRIRRSIFDLPEDIQWIGTSCVTGDTLYFSASVPDGGKETYTDENGEEISYDTYSEVIFRFDLDTGECVQLDNYVASRSWKIRTCRMA